MSTNRIETSAFTLEPGEPSDHRFLLTLHGELDVSVAIETRRLLEDALDRGNDVVIDLAGLEFVDSTGLSTLLRVSEHAAAVNRDLKLTGPLQHQVRRVLRLTGLDRALPVHE